MGRYVGLLLARRHPAKQATLVRKSHLGDKLFALKLLDATLQLRNLALVEFYGLRRGGHRNRTHRGQDQSRAQDARVLVAVCLQPRLKLPQGREPDRAGRARARLSGNRRTTRSSCSSSARRSPVVANAK